MEIDCGAHHPQGEQAGPAQGTLTARDAEHRLARYLHHAAKTGADSQEIKDQLLALEVEAGHPFAAPTQLRRPYERHASVLYVDTSRLPCDHGRRVPAMVDATGSASWPT